jgi:uncharacterized membrane protein
MTPNFAQDDTDTTMWCGDIDYCLVSRRLYVSGVGYYVGVGGFAVFGGSYLGTS